MRQAWRNSAAIQVLESKEKFSSKNKTHKTLTRKILLGITLSVAKVTVFETSEGTGEQSGDTLGESKHRAVCGCYDARR
jgi:uncharacterized membrane protein